MHRKWGMAAQIVGRHATFFRRTINSIGVECPYLLNAIHSSHLYTSASALQTGGGRTLQWVWRVLSHAALPAGHGVVWRTHWGLLGLALE